VGYEDQKNFYSNMNDILKFKTELPASDMVPCVRTLAEFDFSEVSRGIVNIQSHLSKLDGSWPLPELRQDLTKLNTIYSFVTAYNIFFNEMEELSYRFLRNLELFSDGEFPDFTRTNKSCFGSVSAKETEGENYKIEKCAGTNIGYSCIVTIMQPIQLASIIELHKVNYSGLELMGESPEYRFIRHSDTEIMEQMWCEPITSPHPSCRTLDVEENCKKALNSNDIKNAILGCNFTQARNSPPFVQIAEGGVLINQATTLSSGSALISNPLPLVIYSPDVVTLTLQGEEFLIIPPKKIEALSIHNRQRLVPRGFNSTKKHSFLGRNLGRYGWGGLLQHKFRRFAGAPFAPDNMGDHLCS
jgi:hypothetical protein